MQIQAAFVEPKAKSQKQIQAAFMELKAEKLKLKANSINNHELRRINF